MFIWNLTIFTLAFPTAFSIWFENAAYSRTHLVVSNWRTFSTLLTILIFFSLIASSSVSSFSWSLVDSLFRQVRNNFARPPSTLSSPWEVANFPKYFPRLVTWSLYAFLLPMFYFNTGWMSHFAPISLFLLFHFSCYFTQNSFSLSLSLSPLSPSFPPPLSLCLSYFSGLKLMPPFLCFALVFTSHVMICSTK